MKFLYVDSTHRHQDDVDRMIAAAKAAGYILSPRDAGVIWEEYSDSFAAGWMGLPDEDDLLMEILLRGGVVKDMAT